MTGPPNRSGRSWPPCPQHGNSITHHDDERQWRPQADLNLKKERKLKPGTHARDRDYFKFQKGKAADTVRIGGNSSATLVGLDKRILIRQSKKGFDGMGQTVSQSKLWEELPKSDTGSYRQTSIVDGVTRLWTYRKVGDFPLFAVIGTACTDNLETLENVHSARYAAAGLISLIGLVLVFFARRAIIHMRLETELEERRRSEAELRTAKEEAKRANAAKFEYLAPESHELRNPLSAIKGSLRLLVDGSVEGIPEKPKEILAIANRNTDRLTLLVTDILDVERIETGKPEYNFTALRLDNLVTEAVVAKSGYT